jgi:hypothetical protein
MNKYTQDENGVVHCNAFDDESLALLDALPIGRRPVWLDESSSAVKDFIEKSSRPPIPYSVTVRQARLALLKAGLLDDVIKYMESDTTPIEEKIDWEFSTEFFRDMPTVLKLAGLLKITEKQLDDLFLGASAL